MDETAIIINSNDSVNSSVSRKSSIIQDHWKQSFQTIPTDTPVASSEFNKIKSIGKGGFSRVELYKWDNENFEKPLHVALKTNLHEQQDATFAREYKFLQKLNHKSIVKVYGFTFNTQFETNSLIMEVASCILKAQID